MECRDYEYSVMAHAMKVARLLYPDCSAGYNRAYAKELCGIWADGCIVIIEEE